MDGECESRHTHTHEKIQHKNCESSKLGHYFWVHILMNLKNILKKACKLLNWKKKIAAAGFEHRTPSISQNRGNIKFDDYEIKHKTQQVNKCNLNILMSSFAWQGGHNKIVKSMLE